MIKQMIGKAIQQDKISSIKHLIEKAPPTMKAPNKQDIKISHSIYTVILIVLISIKCFQY